ncbi:MAG: hypothetical protein KAG96_01925 [Ichthyobacteriaceae bacterium]|nr:hypothetical protein [Ichthyobacteriaceae bacterium]
MKNLIKFTITALVVMSVFSTSCVKDEVSEEVKSLRAAQVDYVKAQTAQKNAETNLASAEFALTNAMVKAQELKNIQAEAKDIIDLRKAEADVTAAIAEAKEAENKALKSAKELEQEIASLGMKKAAEYLSLKNMALLNKLRANGKLIDAEKYLSDLNLKLVSGTDINGDAFKYSLEQDKYKLSLLQIEIEALKEEKDVIEGLESGVKDLTAEIAALTNEITELEKDRVIKVSTYLNSLDVFSQKEAALNNVLAAGGDITDYVQPYNDANSAKLLSKLALDKLDIIINTKKEQLEILLDEEKFKNSFENALSVIDAKITEAAVLENTIATAELSKTFSIEVVDKAIVDTKIAITSLKSEVDQYELLIDKYDDLFRIEMNK